MTDGVLADPKVEVIYETNITEYKGTQFIESVMLDREYNGTKELKVDGVFVEIGGDPSSGLVRELGAELGKTGEIIVDQECRTSIPGLFAAGDVTNTVLRQGVVAAANGAIAATTAFSYLTHKKVGSKW